jgi:hypothetical protein
LDPHEFELLLKADRLKKVDKDRDIHWQAFQNQQAKATKGKGNNIKPAYRSFNDFFNYEKELEQVLHPKDESKPKYSAKVIDMMTREITL